VNYFYSGKESIGNAGSPATVLCIKALHSFFPVPFRLFHTAFVALSLHHERSGGGIHCSISLARRGTAARPSGGIDRVREKPSALAALSDISRAANCSRSAANIPSRDQSVPAGLAYLVSKRKTGDMTPRTCLCSCTMDFKVLLCLSRPYLLSPG